MKPCIAILPGLGALLLAACTAYSPTDVRIGQTEAEFQATMGPSTGRHRLPDGRVRLEFARGPMGKHTWMVDLDTDSRVARVEQVLTPANFALVANGWTRADVLRHLGRPGERRHGGYQGGEVWSWRYPTNDCLWYQVSINHDGRVTGGGATQGIDPRCDAKGDPRQ